MHTHDYHNPDNLTPEQIGEGYRLLLKSEIKPRPENREINAWLGRSRRWTDHNDSMYEGSSQDVTYRVPLATWPLPETDRYAELKAAQASGKVIQVKAYGEWHDETFRTAKMEDFSLNFLRIKPEELWTLGNSVNGFTLGEGQQWHRTDWTHEMLPDGWRPHILGETSQGDDWMLEMDGAWIPLPKADLKTQSNYLHHRTRRPLPTPEAPWIPWRGGACPLKDDEVKEPAPTDNDTWECLLHTNAQLGRKVAELEGIRGDLKTAADVLQEFEGSTVHEQAQQAVRRIDELENLLNICPENTVLDRMIIELQSKLTAAEARLKQLEWVPYSVRKPTQKDADSCGYILATEGKRTYTLGWEFVPSDTPYWRAFAPPPTLDTDRVEFEKWAQELGDGYMPKTLDQLFEIWKAARETKQQ